MGPVFIFMGSLDQMLRRNVINFNVRSSPFEAGLVSNTINGKCALYVDSDGYRIYNKKNNDNYTVGVFKSHDECDTYISDEGKTRELLKTFQRDVIHNLEERYRSKGLDLSDRSTLPDDLKFLYAVSDFIVNNISDSKMTPQDRMNRIEKLRAQSAGFRSMVGDIDLDK